MINAQEVDEVHVEMCEGMEGLREGILRGARRFDRIAHLQIQLIGGKSVPAHIATPGGPDGRPSMASQVQIVFLLVITGAKAGT